MSMAENKDYWVGFDLGGTKMLATVFDHTFKPLGRKRKKTKAQAGAEAGLNRVIQTIQATLEEAGIAPDQLLGIGVGCPGPLDLDRGIVFEMPNLGWKDTPMKEVLEKAFGCPVIIANDVDAGVYGEYRFGAAHGARCVVGVFPGTGIGGGCVYEGQIIRGSTGSCMEIGHIPISPDGPLCGCGQRGCLEVVASRLAISAAAAIAAYRGEAPHLLKLAGTDLSNIRSGTLSAAIKAGDVVIEQIVQGAARHTGWAMAGIVNLLAPDIILIGGGLVEAIPDLYPLALEKALKERVMPSYRNTFEVAVAQLGDDATVMGAAAWAQQAIEG